MRDQRFAIRRFIVLAILFGHWLGASPSFATGEIVGLTSRDRIDAQAILASHPATVVTWVKQSPSERSSDVRSENAAPVATVSVFQSVCSALSSYDEFEQLISSDFAGYCARGPPIA